MTGAIGMMFGNQTTTLAAAPAAPAGASLFNDASVTNNFLGGDFGTANPIGTGNYTCEFWSYNTDTASNVRCLWDCRPTGGNDATGFGIRQNSTGDWFHIYSQSTSNVFSGRVNNVWQHVCVMRSSTTVYYFVDGVLQSSSSNGGTANYTGNAWRVSGFRDDAATANQLKGYQDEFRLSKVARYSTSGFTPATSAFTSDSDTVLLFHYDGANNGTTFTDSGPDNRTITRTGSVIVTSTTQVKF
jgi:hypothetical protein